MSTALVCVQEETMRLKEVVKELRQTLLPPRHESHCLQDSHQHASPCADVP